MASGKQVDTRGLSCPQPVVLVMREIQAGANDLTVLLDSEVACENVKRSWAARASTFSSSSQRTGPSSMPASSEPRRGATLDRDVVYLDNAATSWPKPTGVTAAVARYIDEIGANPGRSGHPRAVAAGRLVLDVRRRLAALLQVRNPMRVLLGCNGTWALNLAIGGLLRDGDHVVTTGLEHNSVMRPLQALRDRGRITVSVVAPGASGRVEAAAIAAALTARTALVVVNHASNVTGAVQPMAAIGALCRARGVPLLADAAQTAGAVDIDLVRDQIDLLAFTGHKGLLGPTGTGGLVLADAFDERRLRPLVWGGTGSGSDSLQQPDVLPDRFESGTLNVAGLAGLGAALAWLEDNGGPAAAGLAEMMLRARFVREAGAAVPGFVPYGPLDGPLTGIVSFRVEGVPVGELGECLAADHGILGRQGLHCAPLAHRHLGTFPEGTMRFGFGALNTQDHVTRAVAALAVIASNRGRL